MGDYLPAVIAAVCMVALNVADILVNRSRRVAVPPTEGNEK